LFSGGYGTALSGFSIKKISASSPTDLVIADFWQLPGTANMSILASDFGSTKGWAHNTPYEFSLDFQPGTFDIEVSSGVLVFGV